MILYLDTSALVKLFREEENSQLVAHAVTSATGVVTHAVAYVEACSAFARMAREYGDERVFLDLRGDLNALWRQWEILPVTDALIWRAAGMTAEHGLRAYDSLHLAAAESAFMALGAEGEFRFAAFDDRLRGAAERVGMGVLQAA